MPLIRDEYQAHRSVRHTPIRSSLRPEDQYFCVLAFGPKIEVTCLNGGKIEGQYLRGLDTKSAINSDNFWM